MFEVTIEETFAAGHALRNYKGKCENVHGHNYRCQVTMAGPELDHIGLLVDFVELKRVVHSVLDRMDHQWLNERQFVDAVAVAMITPGPVVITVRFIGYLIAGLSGAVVAALGTFLPCYLFTILPAPYFKKYGKRPALLAFVAGVTAAAIGAITGAVIVLAERSIVDVLTALMTLVTIALLWKLKKAPEPVLVAIAALIGLVAFPRLYP